MVLYIITKSAKCHKFREFAKKAYGIDFSGPPPPLNENIIDWKQSI
jgi:hypothetical protein